MALRAGFSCPWRAFSTELKVHRASSNSLAYRGFLQYMPAFRPFVSRLDDARDRSK